MITLLNRQIEIITTLLLKDDYYAADDLADVLCVSNRTIRNDLSQIRMFLREFDAELKAEPHKGHKIVISSDSKYRLLNYLDSAKSLSQQDIIRAICIVLLSFQNTTYDLIARTLDFSRQTIIKYMSAVEEYLLNSSIEIHKVKGRGLSLEARECDIRDCMRMILTDENVNDYIMPFAEKTFLQPSSLSIARQIISDAETRAKVHFYEQRRLEVLISYSLYRISIGQTLANGCCTSRKTRGRNKDYEVFYDSLKALPLAEEEKKHLVSIFLAAKVRHLNKEHDNDGDARQLAKFLMKKLQLLHPFSKEKKEQFLNGLTTHLKVALYRIRNNIPIQNELLDQIKISISLIYLYTKQQLLSQEEKYDVIFDENEIAYIAMYLASAFETSINLDRQVKVLIVCSFGTTTSAILDSRIRQLITECEIIGPFSKAEADKYLEDSPVDLIISTHDVFYENFPVIVVNPLLSPEDTDYIRSRIFRISYEKMCQNFMTSYVKQEDNKTKRVFLRDLIDSDNIQILDFCDSWEEAIQIAAEPLVRSLKIEQRYVISMIDAVNRLGTYMVLLPETAFVHAGIDSGIYEDCCSLLVVKKPIVLGNVNGKTVRNVVVLGVKNREQLTMLDLVSIFQKEENRMLLSQNDIDVEKILQLHS